MVSFGCCKKNSLRNRVVIEWSLVRREMAREPADSFHQEAIQSNSAGGRERR